MFELHISCTKNIDKLQIDFSDGTSVIQSKSKSLKHDTPLDPNEEDVEFSQEVIQKPQIPDIKRSPKVAEELQNFNIWIE